MFFKDYLKYSISNRKRLRYIEIREEITYSRYYINIKFKLRIKTKKKVIIFKEVYIIFYLSYNLILIINILKSNNIII